MKKIIFVCMGGTCRSPMAVHLLKEKLAQKNISEKICVTSAGLLADNSTTNPNTISVLKEIGINAKPTKAKQLTNKLVNKNTIIITLTNTIKEYLINLDNVYSVSEFCGYEIPDPFGCDINEYRQVLTLLQNATQIIANKIANNEL